MWDCVDENNRRGRFRGAKLFSLAFLAPFAFFSITLTLLPLSTLNEWKKEFPDFSDTIKKAKTALRPKIQEQAPKGDYDVLEAEIGDSTGEEHVRGLLCEILWAVWES